MTVNPKLAQVFNSVPMCKVTKETEAGHALDWNLVVELAIKIVALATIVYTARIASHNNVISEGNRAILNEQYSSNYVEQVINERTMKK